MSFLVNHARDILIRRLTFSVLNSQVKRTWSEKQNSALSILKSSYVKRGNLNTALKTSTTIAWKFSLIRIDYEATVKATNEAQTSAQIAQNNAAEAAAKASISTLHDIHATISGHGPSEQYGLESSQHPRTVAANASPHKDQSSKATSTNSKSIDTIASNHNYANSDFKPSTQFSYAGY